MIILLRKTRVCAGKGFVRISARLYFESTLYIICTKLATLSLTLWKQIELCFFFKRDSAIDAFLNTASLSQKVLVYPSIGTPNMRNLYRSEMFCSVAVRNATNSEPKVELSTVFCFLENQDIGALFK